MYLNLSGLCAGAFAALCAEAIAPAVTSPTPAEFVPVERDVDITSKLQEMLDGYALVCQRNIPEACANLQVLTRLRGNLYFTSQRCAEAEPRDCHLYMLHRADVLGSYDQFKSEKATIAEILKQPTAAEQRRREQLEAQKQRDEAFKDRMEALERAGTEFRKTMEP